MPFKKISLLALLAVARFSFSQTSTPKYSNEFLNVGAGAAAMGMANSQVSFVDDVTAGYWNPAGLTRLKTKYEGALMHNEYFLGIAKYDYGAFAMKLDTSSTLAVSIVRFGVDNIPDTRFFQSADGTYNYNNVTSFAVADYAGLLSYAKKNVLVKNLSLGANFKIINRRVGPFANAWGFGIDIGAQYLVGKWRFGLMAKDVTGTYNAWTFNTADLQTVFLATDNTIPKNGVEITLPKWIFGLSRYFVIAKKFGANTSLDMDFTFDGQRNTLISSKVTSIDPKLGLEVNYIKAVFLRAGLGNIQTIKDFNQDSKLTAQVNFGIGFRFKTIQIDYALANAGGVGSNGFYSNVFSVKVGI
jgi:hypothetical protein